MENRNRLMDSRTGWKASVSTVKLSYVCQYAVGRRVLDIGCGMGWYSTFLADQGYWVGAMDLRKRFEDYKVAFCFASARAFPYVDKAFDTALIFDVLEHVEDEADTLRELFRVTKKRVILSVPNRDDRNLTRYNLTYQHYKDKSHLREYSLEEIQSKLKRAGFVILHASLEGPVLPKFFAEFLPWRWMKWPIAKGIMVLWKLGMLRANGMFGDIFVVADKRGSVA